MSWPPFLRPQYPNSLLIILCHGLGLEVAEAGVQAHLDSAFANDYRGQPSAGSSRAGIGAFAQQLRARSDRGFRRPQGGRTALAPAGAPRRLGNTLSAL